MAEKTTFDKLNAINVNGRTESKGGLTYLSWAWAWAEVKKNCPDATYEILRDENGLPYFKADGVGYMCMTTVTINGETLMMWLPVMDFKNKAMLQPTMFDVNKTIMRCLTKNLAMFGLGLYIYAGEDLPEEEMKEEQKKIEDLKSQPINKTNVKIIRDLLKETGTDETMFCEWKEIESIEKMPNGMYSECYNALIRKQEKQKGEK